MWVIKYYVGNISKIYIYNIHKKHTYDRDNILINKLVIIIPIFYIFYLVHYTDCVL